MVTAVFCNGNDTATAYGLWQYDYGQVLRIQGLDLPKAVEIHFSLSDSGGESITRIGITSDGVTDVTMPDSMLENSDTSGNYRIYAFVYLVDDNSGETVKKIILPVTSRPKPEGYTSGEDNPWDDAITAVNEAADRAESAAQESQRWAVGIESVPESATDNAKYYAGQAAANAQQTTSDTVAAEAAKKLAETAAANAEISAGSADKSQQSAETAANNATKAQGEAESAQKSAKESADSAITAATTAVNKAAAATSAAEQSASSANNASQHPTQAPQSATQAAQALGQVQDASDTALQDINTASSAAINGIGYAKDQAVAAVDNIKSTALTDIQNAGTAQVQAVQDEGTTQVSAVQQAASEIIADREQITQNANDIVQLKLDVTDLQNNSADGIISNAEGTTIQLTDSSNKLLQGLIIYGKSTQDGEPAPDNPITISNVGDSGSVGVTVTGTNLLDVNAMAQLTIDDKQYQGVEVQGLRPGNYYVLANNKTIRSDYIYVTVHKQDGSYTDWMFFITNAAVTNQSVTIEEGDSIIVANITTSDNRDTTIQKFNFYQIQVNVGSKPLPWEPYKPTQTLTLTTPDGLPGIPVTSGGNITIDGQQYIADAINMASEKRIQHVGVIASYNGESVGDVWMSTTGQLTTGAKVLYQLGSSIETELSPEEIQAYKGMHTNRPNTTISNNYDTYMGVDYIVDTKMYIDSKFAELQQAILATQQQLL